MRLLTLTGTLIACLLVGTNTTASAQNAATAAARATSGHEQPTLTERSAEQQASDWGLRTEEWARYGELMQGPLGIHSPNLDPLTALGIEARSDEERRRYAELQVQVEARRVEKTLAYQRAYDEAWHRLAPGAQRVTLQDAGSAATPALASASERTAVFVRDGCADCEKTVQRLQATGSAFDLYMVGSLGDDARIRDWAQRVNIDPAKVRGRHITLNHDSGRWVSLGLAGNLPAVVRQVGGQWQRLP